MIAEKTTVNTSKVLNKNHTFLFTRKNRCHHNENDEKSKIISEIVSLRQKLGLSIDEHWHDFIQNTSLEEIKEVLSGLRELALIFGILAGVEAVA